MLVERRKAGKQGGAIWSRVATIMRNESETTKNGKEGEKNSYPRAFAIDCEMVGCGDDGNLARLGRIAIVDENLEVLMDEFVKPKEYITDFRTKYSGLTWKDLKNARNFDDVKSDVCKLFESTEILVNKGIKPPIIIIGHHIENDFDALDWFPPPEMCRDTSTYHPLRQEMVQEMIRCGEINTESEHIFLKRRPGLKKLSHYLLRKTIQTSSHCPVEDARCTMLLYLSQRKVWENNMMKLWLKANHSLPNEAKVCDDISHDLGEVISTEEISKLEKSKEEKQQKKVKKRMKKLRKKSIIAY